MSAAGGLFDVRREERRTAFSALLTLTLITTGHTLLETARDALFLARMPISRLPWMYLLIVVFALMLSKLEFLHARTRAGVAGSLFVASIVTSSFWFVLAPESRTPLVLYSLYLWTGVFGSWAMVQVWTLLGRAYTMIQAKRLYGFIGSGAVLGGVLGAMLARFLIGFFSARAAVLFAALLFATAALPSCFLEKDESDADPKVIASKPLARSLTKPMRATMGMLREFTFVRRVLGLVLLSTITVTLADFLFKAEVAKAFTSTKDLGTYLSTFYAITNTIALLGQVFVAPWIFRHLGVQRALLVFPGALFASAIGLVASGGALRGTVVMKALDGALRYSLHKTSMELLLVPVPDLIRERAKPIVDLVGVRGGQALASLFIIGLVACSLSQPTVLGCLILLLSLSWIVLVFRSRKHYLDVFRQTLSQGGLSGKTELPELDLGALEMLFERLNSENDFEVLAALQFLKEQGKGRLIPALILYHPSHEVVVTTLEIFTELGRTDFIPIADRLNTNADASLAAAARRARTVTLPEQATLRERLEGSTPEVAATALISLMARDWISEEEANSRLEELRSSLQPETAIEIARTISALAPKPTGKPLDSLFDPLLIELNARAFDDPASRRPSPPSSVEKRPIGPPAVAPLAKSMQVRIEVVRAMAARGSQSFVRPLVEMLARHELRPEARRALLAIPGALEALDHALSDPQMKSELRVHLPRTICLFDPTRAAAVLERHLEGPYSGVVRFKVLRGLLNLKREHPEIRMNQPLLLRIAETTVDQVVRFRRWGRALVSMDASSESIGEAGALHAAHHLLVDLVKDKAHHALGRVFMIFELLYGESFHDVWRGLRTGNARAYASSLELVENIVRPPLRGRVIALLSNETEGAQGIPMPYVDAIAQMLVEKSSTTRALAEYRAVEIGLDVAKLTRARRASEPLAEEPLGTRILDEAQRLLELASREGSRRAPA